MSGQRETLEKFDTGKVGLSKGALSFVLIVTHNLKKHEPPFEAKEFETDKEGQVAGLGGGAIKKILASHGITRILSSEGGRTSRGSMGRMRDYLGVLNALHRTGDLDLDAAEKFWVGRVRNYFDSKPFTFRLDPSKSLRACVRHLMAQAAERQRETKGTMYAGAVMQHLVGAKLGWVTDAMIEHNGFSVADAPTGRAADFSFGDVAVHVTTAPSEAMMRKCADNLSRGLRPLVVTSEDGVGGARAHARQMEIDDRVDIIEFEQFIATNLFERSRFDRDARPVAVKDLIDSYNRIVGACETDPSLKIDFEA